MYAEIGMAQVSAITCRSMFRHPKTCTAHSVNQWGMMIDIVELTISCMRDRGTYTRSKAKYTKKEIIHSIILQEEEVSILMMDIEEEEEVWSKAKDKLSVIATCIQDT
jgi:hypothetical protein